MFHTFLIISIKGYMKYINYIYVWPLLILSYNLFIVSNIENLIDLDSQGSQGKTIYSHWGLEKFQSEFYVIFFLFIHCTLLLFAIYSKIVNLYLNNKRYENYLELRRDRKFENAVISKSGKLNESLVKLSFINYLSLHSYFLYYRLKSPMKSR